MEATLPILDIQSDGREKDSERSTGPGARERMRGDSRFQHMGNGGPPMLLSRVKHCSKRGAGMTPLCVCGADGEKMRAGGMVSGQESKWSSKQVRVGERACC